jgi:hypothetical protein
MIGRSMIAAAGLIVLTATAYAQDAGGVRLAPGINGGPVGLARPLLSAPMPFVTAHDVQNGMTAADHQATNQGLITKLRGDAGYLAGFSFGTPLAASRQVVTAPSWSGDGGGWSGYRHHHRRPQEIVINNEGPLAVTNGNGNVVQQQSAASAGPVAQQQVVTLPAGGASGGALNLVTPHGNIIQSAPGGR